MPKFHGAVNPGGNLGPVSDAACSNTGKTLGFCARKYRRWVAEYQGVHRLAAKFPLPW